MHQNNLINISNISLTKPDTLSCKGRNVYTGLTDY